MEDHAYLQRIGREHWGRAEWELWSSVESSDLQVISDSGIHRGWLDNRELRHDGNYRDNVHDVTPALQN